MCLSSWQPFEQAFEERRMSFVPVRDARTVTCSASIPNQRERGHQVTRRKRLLCKVDGAPRGPQTLDLITDVD